MAASPATASTLQFPETRLSIDGRPRESSTSLTVDTSIRSPRKCSEWPHGVVVERGVPDELLHPVVPTFR